MEEEQLGGKRAREIDPGKMYDRMFEKMVAEAQSQLPAIPVRKRRHSEDADFQHLPKLSPEKIGYLAELCGIRQRETPVDDREKPACQACTDEHDFEEHKGPLEGCTKCKALHEKFCERGM
mmetsp:Transcript_8137/g.16000  ORF Transcript_8137/g.16000 Transcript_8137/m.16000 type:complete len:121 (-) Transcript_8137:289-651(-)